MYRTLGPLGLVGVVAVLVGIVLVAIENLLIAGGLALILAGLGLVVRAAITGMLRSWGMV
ncbi:DUF7470 family protein [Salinilacihabitans rarus]|uniref:DUF7470 family protein n=1 Tax=Salinilacihabitans rarus TaxID=2961596 RepID=UPI0020C8406F|nr:hypothetical protein [Salinilacihabitans rarus]